MQTEKVAHVLNKLGATKKQQPKWPLNKISAKPAAKTQKWAFSPVLPGAAYIFWEISAAICRRSSWL